MYKVTITWSKDESDYCLTFGEVSQVDASVRQELESNEELEVTEFHFPTYDEMENALPQIREDYPGAEVQEV